MIKTTLFKLAKRLDQMTNFNIPDLTQDKRFMKIYHKVKPYTMTSPERVFAVYQAIIYLENNKILGDIVECGVWKGGMIMTAALTLLALGSNKRNFYLYDTFTGMTKPTAKDRSYFGKPAFDTWQQNQLEDKNAWCYSPLEEVQSNMSKTRYPQSKFFYIKGDVEKTLSNNRSYKKLVKISLLRVDTDWYKSTYHCLNKLFPFLVKNGILILDDFGHWKGARQAAEDYFRKNNIKLLLTRTDYTGRMAVKI